jgi:hypothetical protein
MGGALNAADDQLALLGATSLRYARASDGDALGHRDLSVDAATDAPFGGVVVATSTPQLVSLPTRTAAPIALSLLPSPARGLARLGGDIVVLTDDGLRRYQGGLTLSASRLGSWRRVIAFGQGIPP